MKNKKKILELFGSFLLFITVIISVACIVKYAADHRCLTYEELPEDAIVFRIRESNGIQKKVWEYDVSGNLHISIYEWSDPYNSSTEELISREIVEESISPKEVQHMYETLLRVNKSAREETLCEMSLLIEEYSSFAGIRYMVNGEKETVSLGSGEGDLIQRRLKDDDAREILNWLKTLR
ncbi:MAG: hypothetical protein J6A73_01595 [Lachnospiraceae bacterium]|nr:hypothetical protein [Lachnospiraceae bacterium]